MTNELPELPELPPFPDALANIVNDQRSYAEELDLAEFIRDYARAYARAAVEQAKPAATEGETFDIETLDFGMVAARMMTQFMLDTNEAGTGVAGRLLAARMNGYLAAMKESKP